MTRILARRAAELAGGTDVITRAQRSVVEMTLAIDPLAQANPELAGSLAEEAGFASKRDPLAVIRKVASPWRR